MTPCLLAGLLGLGLGDAALGQQDGERDEFGPPPAREAEPPPAVDPVVVTESTDDEPAPPAELDDPEDLAWPRVFEKGDASVFAYQPQIDSWTGFETISARLAVVVRTKGATDPEIGAIRLTAPTAVDFETRTVLFGRREVRGVLFPNTDPSMHADVRRTIETVMPIDEPLEMSLDEVVAYLEIDEEETPSIAVGLDPPPIFWSEEPAVLAIFAGAPQFEPVAETTLSFAVNTNWDLLLEGEPGRYFLQLDEGWVSTTDLENGPWEVVNELPAAFADIPVEDGWDELQTYIPGTPPERAPKVVVAHEPAELIVTEGRMQFSPIPGTMLMWITNTESDLFLDIASGRYYFLVAGRWFSAETPAGPWSAATEDLPEDFANIPPDHPRGYVLASVTGTSEARAAAVLSTVPRTATISRDDATVEVTYEGEPVFEPIAGSMGVTRAVNTSYSVFGFGARYYCCHQGLWFEALAPEGPWEVCTLVPDAMYSIPSTSPDHNVTYVKVYDSTPDTVTVGQTGGYVGEFVVGGLLIFGLGWLISEADTVRVRINLGSSSISYGKGARYDYFRGATTVRAATTVRTAALATPPATTRARGRTHARRRRGAPVDPPGSAKPTTRTPIVTSRGQAAARGTAHGARP